MPAMTAERKRKKLATNRRDFAKAVHMIESAAARRDAAIRDRDELAIEYELVRQWPVSDPENWPIEQDEDQLDGSMLTESSPEPSLFESATDATSAARGRRAQRD